jgi:hypothetical protein
MTLDRNLEKYNDSDIVARYAKMSGLQPCEMAVFERWLKLGMAILDIGVGGRSHDAGARRDRRPLCRHRLFPGDGRGV